LPSDTRRGEIVSIEGEQSDRLLLVKTPKFVTSNAFEFWGGFPPGFDPLSAELV